jgi:hypothetical protein
MTATATPHLRVSDAEPTPPTTRWAAIENVPSDGEGNGLSTELEEVAVRRLREGGPTIEATEVLPELNQ